MDMIKVMIVENDPLRAAVLSTALSAQKDMRVASAVSKRETAIKQLESGPQVMLLSASVLRPRTLPRFLRSLQDRSPLTRVLIVHDEGPDDEMLIDELRMGVRGYLHATDPIPMFIKAVRAAANGELWAERRILAKTIARHLLMPESLGKHVPGLQPLTGREMDMLSMVMKGASNREIAEMSSISERTVKTHLYRVYRKLNVKSRAKAVALLSHL